MSLSHLAERLNEVLYRNYIRKLGPAEMELAEQWSKSIIRREYPHLTEEQRENFYDNLVRLNVTVVDEWTRRMS